MGRCVLDFRSMPRRMCPSTPTGMLTLYAGQCRSVCSHHYSLCMQVVGRVSVHGLLGSLGQMFEARLRVSSLMHWAREARGWVAPPAHLSLPSLG